jgi:hypothetical protein
LLLLTCCAQGLRFERMQCLLASQLDGGKAPPLLLTRSLQSS